MAATVHPEISRARAQGRIELERSELSRIRQAYEERQRSVPADRYSRMNPGHLYALQEREATMAALLRSAGLRSLAGLRILDVGCGRGATLRQYLEYEAAPELLWGIDLLSSLIQPAQELTPAARLFCGSASRLPFADGSFDLISQFMLFTSVLNFEIRMQIAVEMARVLVLAESSCGTTSLTTILRIRMSAELEWERSVGCFPASHAAAAVSPWHRPWAGPLEVWGRPSTISPRSCDSSVPTTSVCSKSPEVAGANALFCNSELGNEDRAENRELRTENKELKTEELKTADWSNKTMALARDKFVPFSPPLIGEEEIAEVVDTLRSDWITTGPKV